MNTLKKIFTAALAIAMLLALCACGNSETAGGVANYQVKVLDGQGNPLTTGVIVKFLKDGQQVAMQPVNAEGIATKELDKGDYTVELVFTSAEQSGHYDTTAAVLSAEKTSLELSLINALGSESYDLVVNGEDFQAFAVDAGSTFLNVKASVRNYYIFQPTEAGDYEFSVNDNSLVIGYYGAPHFVQTQHATGEAVVDNKFTLTIGSSSLGGSYVIGLDGVAADADAILKIVRVGDPTIGISDMPWTEYKTTHTPTPYTLDLGGKTLKYVDVTGKTEDNQVVYNDADGYYHFGNANGPIVLVHLGVKAPYYSLQYIINPDGDLGQHGSKICEYFFDANDEFLKKEDYSAILTEYFKNMDQKEGVYPLTNDLKYIIQNGCKQWWDKNDPDYNEQFSITDCNPEIGWMFALCYIG